MSLKSRQFVERVVLRRGEQPLENNNSDAEGVHICLFSVVHVRMALTSFVSDLHFRAHVHRIPDYGAGLIGRVFLAPGMNEVRHLVVVAPVDVDVIRVDVAVGKTLPESHLRLGEV